MMPHVLEHRDIKSYGLELIVHKQGALLLKEFVNYTPFMTETAENLTVWGYLYIPYKGVHRHPPLAKVRGHCPSFNYIYYFLMHLSGPES